MRYWPAPNTCREVQTFTGKLTVKHIFEKSETDYSLREFELSKEGCEVSHALASLYFKHFKHAGVVTCRAKSKCNYMYMNGKVMGYYPIDLPSFLCFTLCLQGNV